MGAREGYASRVLRGPTMGTTWSATLAGVAPERLPEFQTAIEAELDLVVQQMSTWEPDSDLSRFNQAAAGTWVTLPDACRFVLGRALAHAADSGGAFDPTVGPAVNLWGFGPTLETAGFGPTLNPDNPLDFCRQGNHGFVGRDLSRHVGLKPDLRTHGHSGLNTGDLAPHRAANLPAPAHVAACHARVDWRRVHLVGETVYQPGGCTLDFSAIAKGYAADRALAALVDLGVEDALIEVGGELKAHGRRADGSPWRVAVRWPDYADGAGPVVALNDLAIATSGDDFRYFEADGRRYSHTLDPRTGRPVTHALRSVTVLHADAIEADALATALLVLGPDAGVEHARRQGLAALFVLRDGDGHIAHPTSGFLETLQ